MVPKKTLVKKPLRKARIFIMLILVFTSTMFCLW